MWILAVILVMVPEGHVLAQSKYVFSTQVECERARVYQEVTGNNRPPGYPARLYAGCFSKEEFDRLNAGAAK